MTDTPQESELEQQRLAIGGVLDAYIHDYLEAPKGQFYTKLTSKGRHVLEIEAIIEQLLAKERVKARRSELEDFNWWVAKNSMQKRPHEMFAYIAGRLEELQNPKEKTK